MSRYNIDDYESALQLYAEDPKFSGQLIDGGFVVVRLSREMLSALKQAEGYLAQRITGSGGYGETKLLPIIRAAISKAESRNRP